MSNASNEHSKLPNRNRPAHGVHINSLGPTIVFVTACTKDRLRLLASDGNHNLLCQTWREATAWLVGRYVVMPDHIHLFAAPGSLCADLDSWMKYWKSQFNKRKAEHPGKWESGHWDTRLRQQDSYDAKWHYVVNNPVRHGLVAKAEEWPFQGEIFHLPW